MRRCRLARQWSEPEHSSAGARSPGSSPSRGVCAGAGAPARESVRRCALLRRLWGRGDAAGAGTPCCCAARSAAGSRQDLYATRPFDHHRTTSSNCTSTDSFPTDSLVASTVHTIYKAEPKRVNAGIHALSFAPDRPNSTDVDLKILDNNPHRSKANLTANPQAPYDLLEVSVSETSLPTLQGGPPSLPPLPRVLTKSKWSESNIDEYVSDILVESLNSLTDRLESIAASTDGRLSIIEKEIKVRMQNARVNTVVHLSPSSTKQMVFENENQCDRGSGSSGTALQRIQRLFEEKEVVEVEAETHKNATLAVEDNFRPKSPLSMEAIRSSDAGGGRSSPCNSLVDSLDDPSSPRLPIKMLSSNTNPITKEETNTPRGDKSEAFFIRLKDDEFDCETNAVVVADHMPETIKRRLQRRHRRRERHAEMVRRGRGRGVRGERTAAVERQCAAIVDALVDDAIARVTREEFRRTRVQRRAPETHAVQPPHRTAPRRPAPGTELPPLPVAAAPQSHERSTRKLYHKSEIHGEKCIEILEIVEYAKSTETILQECVTGVECRKSRIPVPVVERRGGGAAVRVTAPMQATTRRPVVNGFERPPRSERAFEMIPEERGNLALRRRHDAECARMFVRGTAFGCAAPSLSRRTVN